MNTAAKLSAFGVALALAGGLGWSAGQAVGPITTAATEGHGPAPGQEDTRTEPDLPTGLWSSSNGYTLTPMTTALPRGADQQYTFRIAAADGAVVTAFDVAHDKRMHLIVVRRDTSAFQHVHPVMDPDGTWRVPLDVTHAGSYRVYADFDPEAGEAVVLGADLDVAGEYVPRAYPPSRVANVDGYEVRIDGDLVPGRSSKLTLTVVRDGREVDDLEPYLGAYGHLVALRGGDLAYLHVHPDGEPGDGKTPPGPRVIFHAEVPSVAGYRLFLDFRHGGKVRTAEFTLDSAGYSAQPPATRPSTKPPATQESDAGHGHGG
ncbi:hypothetical protein [Actinokineospora xionganensis]|uniref:Secreted protein n=1 Tax=Actinokineospora xionganensis TaxID=2684470 RepID=A0ABR7L023_9PSEU|nr:hypothetical protein [Actinokineospora xionganensis]MBC6445947.1 hypothetical protein [Actinokineospora xionganensis]